MGQLLLQGVYTVHHHLVDALVAAQVLAVLEPDAVLTGVLFQKGINGNDEGRYKLALVGYDGYLVHILVDQYLRLNHLGGNVLAVRGLEQVFDALLQEQLAAL